MPTEVWFRDSDSADRSPPFGEPALLDLAACEQARRAIQSWGFYRPSPLRSMSSLASRWGVGEIRAMDESQRLPLKSFKMLGAVYAAARVMAECPGKRLVAASDGNHGRALAWAAARLGVPCSIYLPLNVSAGREQKIREQGAAIVRVAGTYDEAVRKAHRDAIDNGWIIIQDTALEGFEQHCYDIMHGYTLLVHEAVEQWRGPMPSHVFVQAGVGGFAAATASYLASRFGAGRPRIVIVEPELANCVMASLRRGQRTVVGGRHETAMAGLACGEVSVIAWEVLRHFSDYAVSIDDEQALQTLRLAAELEPEVEIGETGIAGLAAIHAISENPSLRTKFKLDERSRLLAFITEGITDEDAYRKFVRGENL